MEVPESTIKKQSYDNIMKISEKEFLLFVSLRDLIKYVLFLEVNFQMLAESDLEKVN